MSRIDYKEMEYFVFPLVAMLSLIGFYYFSRGVLGINDINDELEDIKKEIKDIEEKIDEIKLNSNE